MKFQPKSQAELDKEQEDGWILPTGIYFGEVIEAEDQVSKNGNEMIMVKINIDNRHIYDYISPHFMKHKWLHFFESAGKMDVYKTGSVGAEDVMRYRVVCQVGKQQKEPHPVRNIIIDYMMESECEEPILNDGSQREKSTVVVVESSSDLPF